MTGALYIRAAASSLEVVRPHCVVITAIPTFAHSLVRVIHNVVWSYLRTVASSLEVVQPYCVVITAIPTFAHSLVRVIHNVVWSYLRTVASSLEVVRPHCVVITAIPTFAHSLVRVIHNAVWPWPYLRTACSKQFGSGTAILRSNNNHTHFAYSLVQVPHKCGTAMAVPTL